MNSDFLKTLLTLNFFILITLVATFSSWSSGPCDYPDDRAKDGSRCGDRAASVRPGGRNPDFNNILLGGLIVLGGIIAFSLFRSSSGPKKNNQLSNYNETGYREISSTNIKKSYKNIIEEDDHDIYTDAAKEFFIKRNNSLKKTINTKYTFIEFLLNVQTERVPEIETINFIKDFFNFTFERDVNGHDLGDMYRVASNSDEFEFNKYDGAIYFVILYLSKLKRKDPYTHEIIKQADLGISDIISSSTLQNSTIEEWMDEIKKGNGLFI